MIGIDHFEIVVASVTMIATQTNWQLEVEIMPQATALSTLLMLFCTNCSRAKYLWEGPQGSQLQKPELQYLLNYPGSISIS